MRRHRREEILDRLVALHDQRVAEEQRGTVRWLRPHYQIPRFGKTGEQPAPAAELPMAAGPAAEPGAESAREPWPKDAVGQITALRQLAAAAPVTADAAARRFAGAPKAIVARHLETLAILGELRVVGEGRYGVAAGAY